MRRQRILWGLIGAGGVAAALAMMSGGKPASAPVVVELAMPPPLAVPAPPVRTEPATDQAAAPAGPAASGRPFAVPTPEALPSAAPAAAAANGGVANGAADTPTEPAVAAAEAKADGGVPMVVTRGSNMRAEPSFNAAMVAHFKAGERVFRMEEKEVLGYHLVRSDKATGWIWSMNLAEEPQPPLQ